MGPGLNESLTMGPGLNKSLTMGSGLNESLTMGPGLNESLTMGPGLNESLTMGPGLNESLTMGPGLNESLTMGPGLNESLTMGPGLNESLTNHQLDSLFSLVQVQGRKRTKPKQNKTEETAKASWNHTCRLPILPPMAGRGANPTDFGAGFVYVQHANRRLHSQQQNN